MAGFGGPKITVDPNISTEQWIETKPGVFQTRHPRTGQPYGGEFIRQRDGTYTPYSLPAKVGSLFDTGIEKGLNVAEGLGRGLFGMERGGDPGAYQFASTPNPINMELKGVGLLGSLIGAKTADLRNSRIIKVAQKLFDQGIPEEVVQAKFPGTNINNLRGKAVIEIADNTSRFTRPFQKVDSFEGSLGEIYNHPELYKNYPELKDIPIKVDINPKAVGQSYYDETSNTFYVQARTPKAARDTLGHEFTHKIQDIEKWQRGGNPDDLPTGPEAYKEEMRLLQQREAGSKARIAQMTHKMKSASPEYAEQLQMLIDGHQNQLRQLAKNRRNYEQLTAYPDTAQGRHAAYMDLEGERQSRTVQNRMDLTPEQRMQSKVAPYMSGRGEDSLYMNDLISGGIALPQKHTPIDIKDLWQPENGKRIAPTIYEDWRLTNPLGVPVKE